MVDNTEQSENSDGVLSRRNYLKLAGASVPLVAGIGTSTGVAAAVDEGGPQDPDSWELTFEDDFDGGSLDTSTWGIGWGWGMGAPGAKTTWARERHVNVRDSNLVLTASKEDWESDGVLYAGNIHSKNEVTVEPPVYFEAKCKFIDGAGWQNAFWSKPNDESWPPEIDVVEYLQHDDSTTSTSHNLHYSSSGTPGDSSTHQTENGGYDGYDSESDLPHNSFHVYGLEWRQDVIRHYVDGEMVEETTDQSVIESFNNGGPEYLMLSLNLDNVGTTDKSGSWDGKEFLCDWVRVWNSPSSGSSGGNEETDDGSSDADSEHYFWARSETGDSVTFEFTASGGNVRRDSSSYEADIWVSADGTSAGGTVEHTGAQLPGFRYEGEITALSYDGPLELYIDDQQVNPENLRTDTSDENTGDGETDDGSSDDSTAPEETEKVLVIDGTQGTDSTARYTFSVTGNVTRDETRSETVDGGLPWDDITDNVENGGAVGVVGNGVDAFRYTGELADIDIRGKATFTIVQPNS